jgi:UDP-2-acetamido-2-deoxy-ribo-hexuluronate aminotransferase
MEFIDLKTQYQELSESINQRIQVVLDHGQYIMGPEVRELEDRLSIFTGAKHCITVSSGTEALLISLMAIGIKPGDEVITTPFSFAATAEVIALLGAKPVFIDIEPDTCNINSLLIEEKITSKTKAIIPVSLFGQTSDMDEINKIAQKNDLIVVEDAAQSFGATYKTKKSCNLSTIGCTSFFPSKPLGCYGDGGALFTNNDDYANIAKEIRIHGQSKRYIHNRIGLGGRMDTLQCAILLAKLDRFDWEIKRRIEIGSIYNKLLNKKIKKIAQRIDRTSVFSQFTIFVDNRNEVQETLKKHNIPTAVHYPIPIHMQPAYELFCCPECCPESVNASKKVMSLPMGPYLKDEDMHNIIDTMNYLIT